MIEKYKCFNEVLINQYGVKFEEGKEYHVQGEIKFQHNGFHVCTNLEDTLRYFDAFDNNVDIAKVIGYGNICKYDDEYNGFYEMFAAEYLKVLHVLTRDEILMFKSRYCEYYNVLQAIEYYQENNTKVYQKKM